MSSIEQRISPADSTAFSFMGFPFLASRQSPPVAGWPQKGASEGVGGFPLLGVGCQGCLFLVCLIVRGAQKLGNLELAPGIWETFIFGNSSWLIGPELLKLHGN